MAGGKIDTICWTCENAVPKYIDGEYIRGCSWSIGFVPVKGWEVSAFKYAYTNKVKKETYCVKKCPKYVKG